MTQINASRKIKTVNFGIVVLSFIMAFAATHSMGFDITSVVTKILIGIMLSISQLILFQRILIKQYAKANHLKQIQVQSRVLDYFAIGAYLLVIVLVIANFWTDNLNFLYFITPLYFTVFLQNVIYVGDETLLCFNRLYPLKEIKKVAINKIFWRMYTVSILDQTKLTPRTNTLFKKYSDALTKELKSRKIKIETKIK